MDIRSIITIDNEIMSGILVFTDTRVPEGSLFDHLEAGITIEIFLEDFPSVSRKQVTNILEAANKIFKSQSLDQLYAIVA